MPSSRGHDIDCRSDFEEGARRESRLPRDAMEYQLGSSGTTKGITSDGGSGMTVAQRDHEHDTGGIQTSAPRSARCSRTSTPSRISVKNDPMLNELLIEYQNTKNLALTLQKQRRSLPSERLSPPKMQRRPPRKKAAEGGGRTEDACRSKAKTEEKETPSMLQTPRLRTSSTVMKAPTETALHTVGPQYGSVVFLQTSQQWEPWSRT